MTELLFTAFIVAVAAVVSLALAAPQRGGRRLMLVGLCAVTFVLTAALAEELLGHPKPIAVEWRSGEATVIAYDFDEGRAIYVWLAWPEEDVPRAYALPWDEHVAREIAEAQQGVDADGGEVVAALAGGRSDEPGERFENQSSGSTDGSLEDRDVMFYPVPHPKPPDKPEPDAARSYLFSPGKS